MTGVKIDDLRCDPVGFSLAHFRFGQVGDGHDPFGKAQTPRIEGAAFGNNHNLVGGNRCGGDPLGTLFENLAGALFRSRFQGDDPEIRIGICTKFLYMSGMLMITVLKFSASIPIKR
jgi:hypothetical protein